MGERYNFQYFEAEYRKYLSALNLKPVSIKNYVSDLHFFFIWTQNDIKLDSASYFELNELFSRGRLLAFYEYIAAGAESAATSKRRISSLRSFISFCVQQQWMKENTSHLLDNENDLNDKRATIQAYLSSLNDAKQKHDLEHIGKLITNLVIGQ